MTAQRHLEPVVDTRTPPHDSEAEKAVIGGALQSARALADIRAVITAADFYEPRHETIWHSIERLASRGDVVDPVTVIADLTRTGDLPKVGGHLYLSDAVAQVTVASNSRHYAEIVADSASRRRLIETATKIQQLAYTSTDNPHEQLATALSLIENAGNATLTSQFTFVDGDSFIFDSLETTAAWWGNGTEILGASGEALMITGVQGTGKSTIAQQLALGRAGFPDYTMLLGYPIAPGRRVLYLAMDRPNQIARSLRRMVSPQWRAQLRERVPVWKGPPPRDFAKHDTLLLDMCRAAKADTVVVDSLKDAAIGLSDDDVGAAYNRARQRALAAGIEVIELHHLRKLPNGTKREASTADDIYGSTWLTSGAGSVLLLSGQPGDPIVGMHHVKQPMDEIGPYKLIHDHTLGTTSIWHSVDLLEVVRIRGTITAKDAAALTSSTANPTPSDIQKARRKLDRLTNQNLLTVIQQGDPGSKTATIWAPKHHVPPTASEPEDHFTHDFTRTPKPDDLTPTSRGDETPSQELHALLHALHAAGTSRAGGSLETPACVPDTPDDEHRATIKQQCEVCLKPMTDLSDGKTTHPNCDPSETPTTPTRRRCSVKGHDTHPRPESCTACGAIAKENR